MTQPVVPMQLGDAKLTCGDCGRVVATFPPGQPIPPDAPAQILDYHWQSCAPHVLRNQLEALQKEVADLRALVATREELWEVRNMLTRVQERVAALEAREEP